MRCVAFCTRFYGAHRASFAGFFLTLLTLSAYFTRLLSHQTPPPNKVAAQLIPVAALSNAAYAFTTLGYLAGPGRDLFAEYGKGIVKDAGVGAYRDRVIHGSSLNSDTTFRQALAFMR